MTEQIVMPVASSTIDFARRAVAPSDLIWRLEVDQYHRMIDAGILTEDDPVELLEGCLVPKMPKSPAHALVNGLVHDAIVALLPSGWFADSQEPITTEDSEPEPDVRVVRGERRAYVKHHPTPQDVGLVVEVSDASLDRDRTLKLRLYAGSRIPVYWIVNLRDRRLETYGEPSGAGVAATYGRCRECGPGDIVPVTLDGVEIGKIAVRDILP